MPRFIPLNGAMGLQQPQGLAQFPQQAPQSLGGGQGGRFRRLPSNFGGIPPQQQQQFNPAPALGAAGGISRGLGSGANLLGLPPTLGGSLNAAGSLFTWTSRALNSTNNLDR